VCVVGIGWLLVWLLVGVCGVLCVVFFACVVLLLVLCVLLVLFCFSRLGVVWGVGVWL